MLVLLSIFEFKKMIFSLFKSIFKLLVLALAAYGFYIVWLYHPRPEMNKLSDIVQNYYQYAINEENIKRVLNIK